MPQMTPIQNNHFNQGSSQEGHALTTPYKGRFAPSPTGPLHLGSLTTALGSWLDAKAHGGQWIVRVEDVDTPRTLAESDQIILQQLKACGLEWDEKPVWQSQRTHLYQAALEQLINKLLVYGCTCSRKHIEETLQQTGVILGPHEELVYPSTCRDKLHPLYSAALRMKLPNPCTVSFIDRVMGHQSQNLNTAVGDFVLRRADGLFSYQLAVVIDDHLQGITHVVRGDDLLSNTARQIYLQQCLGYPSPSYMHLPIVKDDAGEKLSKQTHAQAIDIHHQQSVLNALNYSAKHLGIEVGELSGSKTVGEWLSKAILIWQVKLQARN
jgi:glutamyl-Q tRNA(Asp) synthetase